MGTITNEYRDQAEEDQDKHQIMAEVSFPVPNPYDGPQCQPGPPGKAHTIVNNNVVHEALFYQSNKKVLGQDSLGVPIIKALIG
jgi:hypothetical protein